jgi:hypothetical protein
LPDLPEATAVVLDEKPGIQAIATTAPDRPPLPGKSPTVMRDHEYKRHGTLTLMAGIATTFDEFAAAVTVVAQTSPLSLMTRSLTKAWTWPVNRS